MTTLQSRARSAGLGALVVPIAAASSSARAWVRFQTARNRPALCRLRDMPRPIAPRPAKPTVAVFMGSESCAELVHHLFGIGTRGVDLLVVEVTPVAT